jgi:hypothetical protein
MLVSRSAIRYSLPFEQNLCTVVFCGLTSISSSLTPPPKEQKNMKVPAGWLVAG